VGFARVRAENVKINSVVKSMTQCEHYELKRIDAEIEILEKLIEVIQEQRREIINRKDLNKNEEIDGFIGRCVIYKRS